MLFQSNQEQFGQHAVDKLGAVYKSIAAVGEIARLGDIQAVPFSLSKGSTLNKDVMVETIRTPEKLLVVVVNIDARGYSNLLCHTEITDRHWTFHEHTISSLTLQTAATVGVKGLSNWQEVVKGQIAPFSDVKVKSGSGSVELSGIELSDEIPVRFFVADIAAA